MSANLLNFKHDCLEDESLARSSVLFTCVFVVVGAVVFAANDCLSYYRGCFVLLNRVFSCFSVLLTERTRFGISCENWSDTAPAK